VTNRQIALIHFLHRVGVSQVPSTFGNRRLLQKVVYIAKHLNGHNLCEGDLHGLSGFKECNSNTPDPVEKKVGHAIVMMPASRAKKVHSFPGTPRGRIAPAITRISSTEPSCLTFTWTLPVPRSKTECTAQHPRLAPTDLELSSRGAPPGLPRGAPRVLDVVGGTGFEPATPRV
jgi:hypothetical protein